MSGCLVQRSVRIEVKGRTSKDVTPQLNAQYCIDALDA
jgi:hypothetical protein